MTALSIAALCIFIFGAYAYGAVVVLSLRHRMPVWPGNVPPDIGFLHHRFPYRKRLRAVA